MSARTANVTLTAVLWVIIGVLGARGRTWVVVFALALLRQAPSTRRPR